MTKTTQLSKPQIPAAALVRMSSDQQEQSPEQQRDALRKLAATHNCNIVDWYEDHGISGVDTKKRKGFHRMLTEAQQEKFKVILAWDQDRFSRLDSIDSGEIIAPLRRVGVRMITVAQGEIDWTTFAGRLVHSVQQEGKNQFLVDLSRNVLRGKIAAAKRGQYSGKGPWGYDRDFYDPSGKLVYRAAWGDTFRKPADWTAKLAPSSDPQVLSTIRWIFDTYLAIDGGPRQLAKMLNRRGATAPAGGSWTHRAVTAILKNRCYVGDALFGSNRTGKFHQVDDRGEVAKAVGVPRNGVAAAIVVENAHEAIVERATFDAVQERMQGRKMAKRRPRANDYLLSGVLFCGACGVRMVGARSRNEQGIEYRYYRCKTSLANGGCHCHSLDATAFEGVIVDVLQAKVLHPDNFDRLRDEISKQAKVRKSGSNALGSQLPDQIAKLNKQIERGGANMLLADTEDLPAMRDALRTLRTQRDELQAQLDRARRPASRDTASLIDKAAQAATKLREKLRATDPLAGRDVIHEVFKAISVWFQKTGPRSHRVARTVAEFRVLDAPTRRSRNQRPRSKARRASSTPDSNRPTVSTTCRARIADISRCWTSTGSNGKSCPAAKATPSWPARRRITNAPATSAHRFVTSTAAA